MGTLSCVELFLMSPCVCGIMGSPRGGQAESPATESPQSAAPLPSGSGGRWEAAGEPALRLRLPRRAGYQVLLGHGLRSAPPSPRGRLSICLLDGCLGPPTGPSACTLSPCFTPLFCTVITASVIRGKPKPDPQGVGSTPHRRGLQPLAPQQTFCICSRSLTACCAPHLSVLVCVALSLPGVPSAGLTPSSTLPGSLPTSSRSSLLHTQGPLSHPDSLTNATEV